MNDVAKNIRKIRRQKSITQDALAEQLHVTRQAVSNWETGKNQPDLDMLESISQALGVELTELIYGEKTKTDYRRMQKRFIRWVIVLGAVVLLVLADALFLESKIRAWTRQNYHIEFRLANMMILEPLGCIAAGKLVPAVVSLWRSVQPYGNARKWLRIAGFVLLIPAFCMFLYAVVNIIVGIVMAARQVSSYSVSFRIPLLDRLQFFILSDPTGFRMRLACNYLPFLAGLCLFPAFVAGAEREG